MICLGERGKQGGERVKAVVGGGFCKVKRSYTEQKVKFLEELETKNPLHLSTLSTSPLSPCIWIAKRAPHICQGFIRRFRPLL